uniref:Uncharacterized protein n=1 Tax=Anguilla anguilla TaxID=7936 RepID=A0A0E9W461_ANGAN
MFGSFSEKCRKCCSKSCFFNTVPLVNINYLLKFHLNIFVYSVNINLL